MEQISIQIQNINLNCKCNLEHGNVEKKNKKQEHKIRLLNK